MLQPQQGQPRDERANEVPDRNRRPVLLDWCDCDSQSTDPAMDRSGVAAMTEKVYRCIVCDKWETTNATMICDRCYEQAQRRQKQEEEA